MILNSVKNLSVKNKMIITFLFYFFLIFLIAHFIILPRVNYISKSGKEIMDRRIYLEEQYIKVRNFRKNNEEMKLVDKDIQRLDEVFVEYDGDLQFIETLENLATDNKIEQRISLGKIESEKNNEFEEITLEIFAEGNFLNIMNYLISIETLGYYVNISLLDISRLNIEKNFVGDESNNLNKVICKITADTYWR